MYKILVALVCIVLAVAFGFICIQMHDYLMIIVKSALPILQI